MILRFLMAVFLVAGAAGALTGTGTAEARPRFDRDTPCPPLATLEAARDEAVLVAAGRLVAVHDPIPFGVSVPQDSLYLDYALQVDKLWTGPAADTVWIRAFRNAQFRGGGFKVGARYLVYAARLGDHLWASPCSRTGWFREVKADAYLLGSPIREFGTGEIPTVTLGGLLEALANPKLMINAPAARALAAIADPVTLPAMMDYFTRSGVAGRITAAAAFAQMGPAARPAVPHLIAVLDDPARELRLAAATALGDIGDAGESVRAALLARLAVRDVAERETLANALFRLETPERAVTDSVVGRTGAADPLVRIGAVHALSLPACPEGPPATAALIRALEDRNPIARTFAVVGLARQAENNPDAHAALVAARDRELSLPTKRQSVRVLNALKNALD